MSFLDGFTPDRRRRNRVPSSEVAETLPVVPFVPVRCPRCQRGKPKTYGRDRRVRYHQCRSCDALFKSLEHDPQSVRA